MAIRFSNNAQTTLASGITATATSISVADGSVFPALTPGDHTYVTLEDTLGNLEVVKVTAISSNTLTVTRGQDGTTARAFSSGDFVQLRVTAALLNDLADEASVTLWADVQNKPDPVITLAGDATGSATLTDLGNATLTVTIADDSHNHTVANVDGLQAALNAKQDASTALTTSTTFGGDVSGTYNAIVVADDSHNHVISNVDGLQTALDGKVDLAGDTMTGTLNGTNFTASGDLTVSGDAELALIFLEDQNGTVSSRWGIYAWDDELQFTKRNLSTNAYAGAVLTLDYSTSQATFSGTISSGAITSTGTSTFAGIRVNNSNTALSQGGGNAVRITTNSGYVDVGPMNTSYSHFQTDRSNFYFGQPVHFGGQIYNYVGGGTSDPYWRAGNDGSGSGLDADLLDGQHASAFEPVNATILHQGSDIGNQDWNTFIDGTEASWNTVLNHSGSNRPSSAYTYGTALSFSKSGQAKLQIYAPETSSAGGTSAGMWYRTGWNTGYRDWQRIWDSGNDGSGSGLDADLLDGIQGSSFLRSDTGDTWSGDIETTGTNRIRFGNAYQLDGNDGTIAAARFGTGLNIVGTQTTTGQGRVIRLWGSLITDQGHTYWNSANDGSGSGLDADLLDGLQASQFLRSDAANNNYSHIINLRAGGNHLGNHEFAANTNQTAYSNSSIELREANYGGNATYSAPRISFHWGGVAASSISMNTSGDILIQNNPGTGYENLWAANIYDNSSRVWSAGNDGSGSGLDADTVDGVQGSSFLRSDASDSFSGTLTSTISAASTALDLATNDGYASMRVIRNSKPSGSYSDGMYIGYGNANSGRTRIYGGGATSGGLFITGSGANDIKYNNTSVLWHAGNDGAGSGLDADLLDGFQLSSIPYATDGNSRASVNTANSAAGSAANAITRSCFFRDNNVDFAALGINVQHSTSDNYNFQFGVRSYSDASALRVRVKNNGTWGSRLVVWNSGNDGSGSGLDADLLDGMNASSSVVANTIVARQANGYIYANHINFSTSETENPTINSFFTSNGDGWSRKSSKSHVISQLKLLTHQAGSRQSINFNSYLTQGFYNAANGNSNKPSGAVDYGQLIVAKGIDTGLQIYGGYANTALYWRGWAGSGSSIYSWHKVWDDQNDGSGSGLDADLLDGLNSTSFLRSDAATSGTTIAATDAFRSSRFEEYDGTFAFRISGASGTTRHINLWDSTGDPSQADGAGVSGISWGRRTDNNPYYIIYADKLHTYGGDYSKLILAWHTGVHIGASQSYGGTRFWSDAPGVGSPSELMSIGKGDGHVRIANNLYIGSGTAWHSANDGSGSGLDADLLDGQQGSYYNHRSYTVTNNYLGGHYVSGGSEKPNSSALGAGKLKPIMLSGGNVGVSGAWNDVLWMSTYAGGDVKRSTAIISSKYDATSVWVNKANYDSSTWGTSYLFWNSGNDGSGSGLDADLLDGVQGSSYARADASQTWSTNQINYFRVERGGYSGSLNNANLQVFTTGANSAFMSFHRSGAYAVNMGLDADNVLRIGGWSASANRWVLDMSGNMTAAGNVTAYSDIRLKENIKVIPKALEKVQKIRGVTFTRNDQEDKEKLHAGVIAQEVEAVLPEVISEDNLGIKNVAYGNMVGLLIEAIKELKAEVDDLKAQLKEK